MPASHLLPLPPGTLAAVQGVMSLKRDGTPRGGSTWRPLRHTAGLPCAGCWHTTGRVRAAAHCRQPDHQPMHQEPW